MAYSGFQASLVVHMIKNPPAMQETQVRSLGQEDALGKGMVPTPIFFPGEFHEERSLVGYSPWGHCVLHLLHSLISLITDLVRLILFNNLTHATPT